MSKCRVEIRKSFIFQAEHVGKRAGECVLFPRENMRFLFKTPLKLY